MREIRRDVIGHRLKLLRKQRGLSVQQVAAAVECDRPQLHHAEAGRTGLGLALALDLARFYGTTAEEIVHGPERARKSRVA